MQITCALDWTLFERSCYFLNKQYHNWIESNTSCSNVLENSHLAVVTSEDERNFVIGLAKESVDADLLSYAYIWIGGTDYFAGEGVIEWVTGEPWDSSWDVWAANEPSEQEGAAMKEDCIAIRPLIEGDSNAGKWCDFWCTSLLISVCEREM